MRNPVHVPESDRSAYRLLIAIAVLLVVTQWGQMTVAQTPLPSGSGMFTLSVKSVRTVNHVAEAKRLKDRIAKISGLQGFYVVSGESESVIYYGSYQSIDAASGSEAQRAQSDRQTLSALHDETGARFFDQVYFMPVVQPDPAAPAEWDLKNAKGFYTLEIAVYKGDSRRKQAAVDSVAEARKQGIEAYFYHGEVMSSVCIGTWPQEAVSITGGGDTTARPNQGVIVLPFNSDKGGGEIIDEHGERMKVVAPPRVEILDPTLRSRMLEYKDYAVNGEVRMVQRKVTATGEVQVVPSQSSKLVQIPRDSLVTQMSRAAGQNGSGPASQSPVMSAPTGQSTPGSGKLQGIK